MKPQPTIDELEAILNSEEAGPHVQITTDGHVIIGEPTIPWPDPTPEMLADPQFNAIWNCIKSWDINVPAAYSGYCGANGNHARAILDALRTVGPTTKTPACEGGG